MSSIAYRLKHPEYYGKELERQRKAYRSRNARRGKRFTKTELGRNRRMKILRRGLL